MYLGIMYQALNRIGDRYFKKHRHTLFKLFFNLSPMYRRSTGRVIYVARDFGRIEIKIPRSYKNKNYVGSIFGGSLFSATDPIYMVQLIQILGRDFVVWDKETTIKFKRPAWQTAYAVFEFSEEEIEEIKDRVAKEKEIDVVKVLPITSKDHKVFAEAEKTIFISDKAYYKKKRKEKEASTQKLQV